MSVNLLPSWYTRRQAVRRRTTLWLRVTTVWCVALAAAGGATASTMMRSSRDIHVEVREASDRAKQARDRLDAGRKRVGMLQRQLSLVEEIAGHPSWSVLLRELDAERKSGVVLDRVKIGPMKSPAASKSTPAAAPAGFRIVVRGLSRNVSEATEYAARLQSGGLFDSLSLTQTSPRIEAGASLVEFEIEGALLGQSAKPAGGMSPAAPRTKESP